MGEVVFGKIETQAASGGSLMKRQENPKGGGELDFITASQDSRDPKEGDQQLIASTHWTSNRLKSMLKTSSRKFDEDLAASLNESKGVSKKGRILEDQDESRDLSEAAEIINQDEEDIESETRQISEPTRSEPLSGIQESHGHAWKSDRLRRILGESSQADLYSN